jgi:hypothetical protein
VRSHLAAFTFVFGGLLLLLLGTVGLSGVDPAALKAALGLIYFAELRRRGPGHDWLTATTGLLVLAALLALSAGELTGPRPSPAGFFSLPR